MATPARAPGTIMIWSGLVASPRASYDAATASRSTGSPEG